MNGATCGKHAAKIVRKALTRCADARWKKLGEVERKPPIESGCQAASHEDGCEQLPVEGVVALVQIDEREKKIRRKAMRTSHVGRSTRRQARPKSFRLRLRRQK